MTAPARTITWAIGGRLERAHIAGLCRDVTALLEKSPARTVVCDVSALVEPDCVAVDALARIQLTARRLGARVLVRLPSDELKELLGLCGLEDAVPCRAALLVDPLGEAEHREQTLGVEEEREPGDPSV